MLIIPAIDLKDGKCVRLKQGVIDDATVFSEDPGAMAAHWVKQGARRLHVVDLNGAAAGKPKNESAIKAIVAAVANRIPVQLGGAGLLVNTTTLGMVGQPPLELNLRCPASLVVADLVYAPLLTGLLAAARERGLRTADGLGMLLHQAVRGFELWFGVRPEVTAELRALVEADLKKK